MLRLSRRCLRWQRRGGNLIEVAIVVLVPEAETLVEPFRKIFDPSAAKGMPAHITINYPFSIN